ncbi:DUF92 domain-containing protein [Halothermothrix orenii]|uniref:DUF92 domain-containing protein n=1 Tax=Halothermothrix orenii (strain H 168 / OCM 544 / DSM 9562) TaxID=373903 RepID=B8CWB4_HALOH|nr:DUF92 domain-containing protein [Halothermothrix orenii]ACL69583.1 conserved hypothetical protein TIGR00297 [Halothermothrix orenii H 168]
MVNNNFEVFWVKLGLGLLLSLVFALIAYKKNSLSKSGIMGAILVGTIIFGCGGFTWFILLGAFFVSSSLLSHFKIRQKKTIAREFQKTGQRDLGQTLANGGIGIILACLKVLNHYPATTLFYAYLGVIATVNADTWATELGVLSKTPPRLITSFKKVARGTSGGVTWLGLTSSLAGGFFIGFIAFCSISLLKGFINKNFMYILISISGGLAGSLTDSLLGATYQGIYYCPCCEKETERLIHYCGQKTRLIRGFTWLNNDLVNLISSVSGALVSLTLGLYLF